MIRHYILVIMIATIGCSARSPKSDPDVTQEPEKSEVTIETILGEMTIDELKNKSSSFLRYSRNQYFAKHGYIFNDPELALFYEHQPWYTKEYNSNVILNSTEQKAVNMLLELEKDYGTVEYSKIIHGFVFNNLPLFYIGWEPQTVNGRPDEFFSAGFALLDSSLMWTLKSSSIPPEFIKHYSTDFVELIDFLTYLRRESIQIKNIDSNCKGGEFDEIIVRMEGPSSDYHDIILGFDNHGKFDTLFNEFVKIDYINRLNDSTLEFSTTTRCDFIGTMFCSLKYRYNTITKESERVPYDFEKVNLFSKSLENVELFLNSISAVNNLKDSVVGYIPSDTRVEIIKYLDIDDCYEIKSDNLTGWINNRQLQKFEVSFAD